LKNRHKQFVLDGEVVVLGVNGISDFNALHSGKHNHEVQLYAFDVLAMDGVDLGDLPLSIRKTSLARLLHRRPDGIFQISYEQGEIGPQLFPARLSHGAGRLRNVQPDGLGSFEIHNEFKFRQADRRACATEGASHRHPE